MSNLLRMIGRRLIALPIMIFGVTILVFFVMALSPIDQAYSVLGENATEAQVQQYREDHGLNDPILVQYGNYMVGLAQGDLGTYGANNASVAERIGQALPVTLQLTFFGLIIGVVVAVILGVVSALYRDRWPDQIIRVFSIACIATPSFWLAVLMILLFSSMLHVLPASGPAAPAGLPTPADGSHAWRCRPSRWACRLSGQLTRVIRTSMVEELDRDYVRTALGAGIPKSVVVARNVLRNALITPGDGARPAHRLPHRRRRGHRSHLQPALAWAWPSSRASSPATRCSCRASCWCVAITFIIINIIVDMLYILIDPRIRTV